jgi:hypothetical protein
MAAGVKVNSGIKHEVSHSYLTRAFIYSSQSEFFRDLLRNGTVKHTDKGNFKICVTDKANAVQSKKQYLYVLDLCYIVHESDLKFLNPF